MAKTSKGKVKCNTCGMMVQPGRMHYPGNDPEAGYAHRPEDPDPAENAPYPMEVHVVLPSLDLISKKKWDVEIPHGASDAEMLRIIFDEVDPSGKQNPKDYALLEAGFDPHPWSAMYFILKKSTQRPEYLVRAY